MTPFDLPQTFLLPADMPFSRIAGCLEALGFSTTRQGLVTPPLIDGEPELGIWTWRETLPEIHCSFNAVARLRLLDVATVPPALRAEIASVLTPLRQETVAEALRSDDERKRLWGIWAALETERIDLIDELTTLRASVSGMLLEELDAALLELQDLREARVQMLTAGRVIAGVGQELIETLSDVRLLKTMLPTIEDCRAVFDEDVADDLFSALQSRPLPKRGIKALPETSLAITAASAGALRWPNELSVKFPRGYRIIAGWMKPNRVWLTWKGREPDGGERLMDGLVFVDDRWLWMPKVYRELEDLIAPSSDAPKLQ